MVCPSNNVSYLFECLPADFVSVHQLCQTEQCTDKYREECDFEGEEETTQGETREGVEQWRRERGVWRLTYHPAVRQFLALSFNLAHKQTT